MRLSIVSTLALVALGSLGLHITPLSDAGAAQAAEEEGERDKKQERRVLKMDDLDKQTLSEVYRAKAREKRHESIAFLKDILANRAPQGEQKAEMMLRLADLYFEEGRDLYLTEMQTYETAYDKCFNTPGCNPETMKADNTTSYKWQSRSIKLYKQILRSYPQYQRADEATFYLASALQDTGQRDEAVKEFTRLVRTYPQSGWIPDAYIQIGEYYFDKNNAYKALLAYQKATRYKNSDKYAFAMYKLGWCYYNVGEYGKGIDTMKAVVAYSMASQEGANQKNLTLQDEALKDLVRFFADAGEMDEAYAYFNKLGKKNLIRAMLTRLATTYFEQGKFEQCIQTYRRLIAEDPQSADAPGYQNEIILAYQKIGRKKETLSEIDRLLKTYGKNSAWARANSADQESIKTAENYVEKNLRTVAINYHNDAKKLGNGRGARESYELAYKAYTVYIQEFPSSKYNYDVRYAFGELLYKLKKFDEAYVQYMKVVEIDPKGKHSRFCAESAIFAADEMIKSEKKAGRGPAKPAGKTDVVALTDWENKLLTACDQFSKVFKEDKKVRNIIYKSAYLLYNHNMFKEASDRFRIVIGMNPSSKEAEQAANLILDSFTLVEDWNNLKEVSKAFYDQEGLGSSKFKKEVYNIYERASFKLIEVNFASSKDEKAAGDGYMAFYAEFPKSQVADQALNNASVYYHNINAVAMAMKARIEIIEKFPKSKYFNEQVASLGFDYETIADFDNAAILYEKLWSLDKEHKSARDAIYSAALFRRAMGDWETAIKNRQLFISNFPDDDEVANLTVEIAQIYEENDKLTEASKVYYTFFTKPPKGATSDQIFYARLHYGFVLEEQRQITKAKKHYVQTLEEFTKAKAVETPETKLVVGTEVAAQIMFKQAKKQIDTYMDMSISGPSGKTSRSQTDKILIKQLSDKAKALTEVEKTFVEIISTGAGEWGLASLVDLGKAYQNMSSSLTNSYFPPYLTDEQVEIYRMGLEDKAYLQDEKAVQAYTQALSKSYELNLYNDYTAFAIRALGELRPDEYPTVDEKIIDPRFTTRTVVEQTYEEQP